MFVFSIGILTQIVTDEVLQPFGRTFIPAAYVKYIESGGSRVMPIRSYTECFHSVNEEESFSLLFVVINYSNNPDCVAFSRMVHL